MKEETKVSIYLRPNLGMPGMGTDLLHAGHQWLKKNRPQVKSVVADVLQKNLASNGAFQKAGYQLTQKTYRLNIN
jgi:RimJ/RimL family protein N-acetyltransferase